VFKKTTLKNGLRIITVPLKNTQSVTVLVLVGTGSKYETKEINGISHFLEHLFFKGTKKRPNPLKIAEQLDRVGGMYNAFTGEETTGYWAKVNSEHFDLALDWVSDILLNTKLKQKDIEREKGVILEEINMYLDLPMSYVGVLWDKLLYGDQPAGRSILGEKTNIISFKRKDFSKYYSNHYLASNTVVCVAGNITKSAEAKIKKYFQGIKTGSACSKKEVREEQVKPQSLIHFKKTDQTHLCLGVRGYNLFHKQRYIQDLLAVILGGNMSSRLFMVVRERQGLAYYIRTSSEKNTDTGCLVTQAGVDNKKVEKAIKSILKEYNLLKIKKITKQELQKAKDYVKGTLSLSLESSDAQASFYAGQELLTQKMLSPKECIRKINKVTVSDIQKVAKDIFQPEKLNLALIGPFKDREKFQRLLKL